MIVLESKQDKQAPLSADSTDNAVPPPPTVLGNESGPIAIDCNFEQGTPETAASPSGTGGYSFSRDGIPGQLIGIPNWIHWRMEFGDKGKPTKVPYVSGTHILASSTDPGGWKPFEAAASSLGDDRGVGFVLPLDGVLFFIDLDDVRNPDTGHIDLWAEKVVKAVDSYTEISPSGTGVHILGRRIGTLPSKGTKHGSGELYFQGRFATVTGKHLAYAPKELKEADTAWLYTLIENNVFKFGDDKYSALFQNCGNQWESLGYTSQSEADMALCSLLAKRLKGSVDDIDVAFRLSGLMREKWDEKRSESTYGRDTILKVIGEGIGHPAYTDLGNAERLVRRHGHDLRYCYPLGQWLIWDGTRFAIDRGGEIEQRAKETVLAIDEEGTGTSISQQNKARNWGKKSQQRGAMSAMVQLARSEPGIAVNTAQLDADPWILNCQNGTIDLKTGLLREHSRHDLITKLAGTTFDPGATCPRWDSFLYCIMDGDMELIAYVQKAVGYSLTGLTQEQVMFFEYGTGANGKTVFSEILNHLLGNYATTASSNLLLARKSEGVSDDIARLEGARLVLSSETPENANLNEALVKRLTGQDKIAARHLYSSYQEFYSTAKIWLITNDKPNITSRDVAIWRRIRLIPFTVTIPGPEQDKQLTGKLLSELPGILAWAVRGCLAWQQEGLNAPEKVVVATRDYKAETDVLGEFIEEYCITDLPTKCLQVSVAALYAAYRRYSSFTGPSLEKNFPTSAVFGKRLSEKGFGAKLVGNQRFRTGIALKPDGPSVSKHTMYTGVIGPAVYNGAHSNTKDSSSKLSEKEQEKKEL